MSIIVYTDGGARGNPGPAGVGVYVTDEKGNAIAEFSKFIGEQTNNFAEYQAVIEALKQLKKIIPEKDRRLTQIQIRLDSELVTKQLNGQYQVKEKTLFPLFMEIWNMRVKDFPNISFTHVRRENNKEADRLANEAMDTGV